MRPLLPVLAVLLGVTALVFPQSNGDCLDCHNDPGWTMEKKGKEISLHVDPDAFTTSPHGDFECIDCHVDFDPDEEPHAPNIVPVACVDCHDDVTEAMAKTAHAGEIGCTGCHTNVHVQQSPRLLASSCGSCHTEESRVLAASVHGASEVGAGCMDCHGHHELHAVGTNDCLSCHGEKEFVEKNIVNEDYESVMHYSESIHGEAIDCFDCHGAHDVPAIDDPASPVNRENLSATCAECHDDVVDEFVASEHGKAFAAGFESAPGCTDCHGEHDIRTITDSEAAMSRLHEVEVCLSCHLDSPEVQERMTHDAGFIAGYGKSIHGRAHLAGNEDAAICSDCHGAHTPQKASDPNSKVHKFNIAETCGNCHGEIVEQFEKSIHGIALANGVLESPTCTDCHGEHQIIEPEDEDSPVAAGNVSAEVCAPCHSSVRMSEKFGMRSQRVNQYLDSYHGLAVSFGSVEAANCASCHGVHDILPSSNPESMIHPGNLAETCGSCHPGANENFAIGKVHLSEEDEESRLLFWISSIYIFLIVGTIGAMGLHNAIDWWKKTRLNYKRRHGLLPPEPYVGEQKYYERMTRSDRITHVLLLTSFFMLTITGFMLKFPNAWWVMIIRDIFGDGLFAARGWLHRAAAVVMTGVSFYHLGYVIFTARGRQFIKDMWFRWQDVRDMGVQLKYNLGLAKHHPHYDRFNYIEKAEYWALIWGTIVMTITGFALWFENQTMGWFSKLFVDAMELVHYYEAWLAFLAILVWHIYYVIFNPDAYPMNFTWLTGKISEADMKREHPAELERLQMEGNNGDDNGAEKDR